MRLLQDNRGNQFTSEGGKDKLGSGGYDTVYRARWINHAKNGKKR